MVAPGYCTGLGKAMMAFLPEDRLKAWVNSARLKSFTPNTLTDAKLLLEDLRIIRQRGYSVDNSEHEENVRCIGAPVRDRTGAVIAAISIAGPDTPLCNRWWEAKWPARCSAPPPRFPVPSDIPVMKKVERVKFPLVDQSHTFYSSKEKKR